MDKLTKHISAQKGDGFLKYSAIKLPDTQYSWFDVSMTLHECKKGCLRNCSCVSYSNLDIRNTGSGYLLSYGDLIDIRELPGGQDIHIKMDNSELGSKKTKLVVLSLSLLIGVTVIDLVIGLCILKKKKRKMNFKDNLDLLLFALSTLNKATSNFSVENKIGESRFGSVYKVTFEETVEASVRDEPEEIEIEARIDEEALILLHCARFISVERYDLATVLDDVGSFPTKISIWSRLKMFYEFKEVVIDQRLKFGFQNSCFGSL
ncbi:hypothetical protein CQW23_00715 [Capsicum baccatum]|uniref:Apple domain-containing protein n=1 Tax=Capsicum baccatum TaxID=33114 RepID=A0A2G2XLJ2_CAPBA|nr:hypothetical protein CQW23_00715 [Capsicum baccatum]